MNLHLICPLKITTTLGLNVKALPLCMSYMIDQNHAVISRRNLFGGHQIFCPQFSTFCERRLKRKKSSESTKRTHFGRSVIILAKHKSAAPAPASPAETPQNEPILSQDYGHPRDSIKVPFGTHKTNPFEAQDRRHLRDRIEPAPCRWREVGVRAVPGTKK
jgi:hypothetical protein